MKKNIIRNIFSLYGMSIAKIIFPLLTAPYLSRVLSVDSYGVVSYVRTLMQYMQVVVDFGFLLSGTKDIVEHRESKTEIEYLLGDILLARIILAIAGFVVLTVIIFTFPILQSAPLFTFLSYVSVFLTVFLFDFYFRGIEKMQVITLRFVVMKAFALILTYVLIRSDADILWIPVLDIIGTIFAIVLIIIELKKDSLKIKITGFKNAIKKLLSSAVYFVSEMASTVFGAITTLIMGLFMSTSDIAYWSVCMQLVGGVQALYTPITGGIYPDMVKTKDKKLVKKVLLLIMPVVLLGCIFVFFASENILQIIYGAKYTAAYFVLRGLIPVLFFGFPAMLFGWPTLGAIGKAKQVTITTFATAFFQIAGLAVLILTNKMNLMNITILRGATELVLLITRYSFFNRYKSEFNSAT